MEKWIKEKFKAERPLTKNEEDALFALVRKGNKAAKAKLMVANMKFVIQVAANYRNETLTQEELVNEGAIGLWRSIDYFDETRGVRFITYAVWWIKASITRAISEKGSMVRLPLNRQTQLHKAKASCKSEPLPADIKALDAVAAKAISLNAPVDELCTFKLEELLPDEHVESPDTNVAKDFIRKFARSLLNKLPARERQIMQDIHGIGRDCERSIREESHLLGLSRERVRQLRDQAKIRIRRLNCDGHLTPVLRELATSSDVN